MTRKRILDGLLVFLLACLFFGYGMNGRVLRRNSEARVARVAQEMIERGDWVVGFFNGKPRLEKPPASSWPVALSAMAFSQGQVQPRDALLPTALSGALMALLIYGWLSAGGCEHARMAGLLGAFFVTTMAAIVGQARSAEMDMHVALFTALAFFGLERHRLHGRLWGLPVCYLALGLGILVKAHVILLVFLPPALIWHFWRRSSEPIPPREGAWKWHLVGLALLLLTVLPWAIPFLRQSGLTFDDFWKQGVDRFDKDSTGHSEPWHFYLGSFWAWTLPGVLLLPFVVWSRWRQPEDAASPARRLWWLWLLVNLVLWSCVTAKQRHYAVPWLVPVALILGQGVAAFLRRSDDEDAPASAVWGRRATVFLGVLLAGLAVLMVVKAPETDANPLLLKSMTVICVAGFLMGSTVLWAGLERGFFECWWGGALCLLLLYAATYEADEDLRESPAGFCTRVRDAVPPDAPLYDADLATRRAVVVYYLKRTVTPLAVPEPGDRTFDEFTERLVRATIAKLRAEPGCHVLTHVGIKNRIPPELFTEPVPGESNWMGHRTLHAVLLRAAEKAATAEPAGRGQAIGQ